MEYESLFKAARKAGTALADVEPERLGRILQHAARLLRGHAPALLEANARDLRAMPASSPMRDRLRLTPNASTPSPPTWKPYRTCARLRARNWRAGRAPTA